MIPLLAAATSPSMPGSSLEFVAPDGEFRRLEPQKDNARASADGAALHHVADGIRVQRAEAMGGSSHSIAVGSSVVRANIGSSLPPAPVRMPRARSPCPRCKARRAHLATPKKTTPRKGWVGAAADGNKLRAPRPPRPP